jgi:hypothetical protein
MFIDNFTKECRYCRLIPMWWLPLLPNRQITIASISSLNPYLMLYRARLPDDNDRVDDDYDCRDDYDGD